MIQSLFGEHIQTLCGRYCDALQLPECSEFDAVLIHSGSEQHYYGDDRAVPFQAYGHFCNWLPVNKPDQFILAREGKKPRYFQVVPNDFWYDQHIENQSWWADHFDVVRLESVAQLQQHLDDSSIVYLGESGELAKSLGADHESRGADALAFYLDYQRAYKTRYEIECLQKAADLALQAHAAARETFLAGASEYEIHQAYLQSCQALEDETPYTNIVAINDKSAILHYQHKRKQRLPNNGVLLIDAGCRINNYGSDITRTTANAQAHPLFHELLLGMEKLELDLVAAVQPGLSYVEIHQRALKGVAELLSNLSICRSSVDDLMQEQIPQLFMPHGVGHLLGVQVHDVGGHQSNPQGDKRSPPEHSPALRNTRTMEENMVFTIEPGCYFIPMLLEPVRKSSRGDLIDWQLVDELTLWGGIRIEDNVVVTDTGQRNLSRSAQ